MQIIQVSDVQRAKQRLPVIEREQALRALLHAPVEQLSPGSELVLSSDLHPLVAAANSAFYDHRPLRLSPDSVWFCLVQGLAHHISVNADALRERLGRGREKQKLVVNRPDFLLGQRNPWPEAFAAFSDQIALHLGKLRDLVVADFSTTGPTELAAFQVALMDTFQPYFEYEMQCGCGIPSITLTGTPDDWRSIRRRAAMLSELGLEWWTDSLLPALDQLVLSSEGRPDRAFWQSFFRHESSSGGGNELTGWIQLLFPYLVEVRYPPLVPTETRAVPAKALDEEEHIDEGAERRMEAEAALKAERTPFKNPFLPEWQAHYLAAENRSGWLGRDNRQGPSLHQVPSGTASAPVLVIDERDGSTHPLRFVAGMFGVSQDAAGTLAPEFGWAVVHASRSG